MPSSLTSDIEPAGLRECAQCGLFQRLPQLARGQVAECPRCGHVLRRARRDLTDRTLALGLAGLVLYAVAVLFPFLQMEVYGRFRSTTLPALPGALGDYGSWELSLVVLGTTILTPLAVLCLTVAVLAGLRQRDMPGWVPQAMRWRERLAPWSMVEVFLLGVFVAYTRLVALAAVGVGPALWALGGLMLVMVALDALLDRASLWEAITQRLPPARPSRTTGGLIACDTCGEVSRAMPGMPCPVCATRLEPRKPGSLARTSAFMIAAAVLYVPANFYPILTYTRLGYGPPSTILGGVKELIELQMWPLALLVFVASICVPMLKLCSITLLLLTTRFGSAWRLRDRTRLYRIVDVIGRWSMIDVFMLAVLVALVQVGQLATVVPGLGAVCFAAVVVLTMLSSFSFDPRLMWDAAERRAARPGGVADLTAGAPA